MITPEYAQGDWQLVIAEGCLALLPADTNAATSRRLWRSMRRGEDLMSHLVIITDGRFEGLPSFALARIEDSQVHMMLRGAVEVSVTTGGELKTFDAGSVSTWLEQIIDGVESVALHPKGGNLVGRGDGLPILSGIAQAANVRVDWGEEAIAKPAQEPEEATLLTPAPSDIGPPTSAAVPSPAVELPLNGTEAPRGVWLDSEAVSDDSAPMSNHNHEDHDGMTVMNSEVVALRQELPAWEGDAVPGPMLDPADSSMVPKIVLSTGLAVALDRPVLLGRAPQVSRVRNDEMPRLVTVASPNHDISRTHAEVRMAGESIVVTDLASTNGVLLTRPGAVAQRLDPGEPIAVEAGAVVDLGEGVTFVVGRQS